MASVKPVNGMTRNTIPQRSLNPRHGGPNTRFPPLPHPWWNYYSGLQLPRNPNQLPLIPNAIPPPIMRRDPGMRFPPFYWTPYLPFPPPPHSFPIDHNIGMRKPVRLTPPTYYDPQTLLDCAYSEIKGEDRESKISSRSSGHSSLNELEKGIVATDGLLIDSSNQNYMNFAPNIHLVYQNQPQRFLPSENCLSNMSCSTLYYSTAPSSNILNGNGSFPYHSPVTLAQGPIPQYLDTSGFPPASDISPCGPALFYQAMTPFSTSLPGSYGLEQTIVPVLSTPSEVPELKLPQHPNTQISIPHINGHMAHHLSKETAVSELSHIPSSDQDITCSHQHITQGDSGVSSSDTPPISLDHETSSDTLMSVDERTEMLERLRGLNLHVESQHSGRSLILTGRISELKNALEVLRTVDDFSTTEPDREEGSITPVVIDAPNVEFTFLETS